MPNDSRTASYLGETVVILIMILIALVILALTLATFDRCLGRMSEQPRRAPRMPRARPKSSVRMSGVSTSDSPIRSGSMPDGKLRKRDRTTRRVCEAGCLIHFEESGSGRTETSLKYTMEFLS